MPNLAFIGNIGVPEIIIILVIGLLLFGSRLPEVGRSVGKGLLEFKKGLRGVQDQMSDLDREAERQVDDELARRNRLAATPMPPAPVIDVTPVPAGNVSSEPIRAAGDPAASPSDPGVSDGSTGSSSTPHS